LKERKAEHGAGQNNQLKRGGKNEPESATQEREKNLRKNQRQVEKRGRDASAIQRDYGKGKEKDSCLGRGTR